LVIDDEFKYLLPPLDAEAFAALEENLLQHGVRDAVVVWRDPASGQLVLIDGHNRFELAAKHGLDFAVREMDFGSRAEVLIWMVSTQVARRNLSGVQLAYFRGLHYRADKLVQGSRNQYVQAREVGVGGSGGVSGDGGEREKGHSDPFQSGQPGAGFFGDVGSDDDALGADGGVANGVLGSTARRLSEKYRVSAKTVKRDAKLSEGIDALGAVSEDAKRRVISGEAGVSRRALSGLGSASKRVVQAAAKAIERGERVGVAGGGAAGGSDKQGAGAGSSDGTGELREMTVRVSDEVWVHFAERAEAAGVTVEAAIAAYLAEAV